MERVLAPDRCGSRCVVRALFFDTGGARPLGLAAPANDGSTNAGKTNQTSTRLVAVA